MDNKETKNQHIHSELSSDNNSSSNEQNSSKSQKENPWLNLGLNVIIPSIIMTKFSDEQSLGHVWGLVVALAFPLSYGFYDYLKWRKMNFFSALGLLSVLMTGGIGLLKLNRSWMIIKETAIPAIMGFVVWGSGLFNRPLVRLFLEQIMELKKIDGAFARYGHQNLFEDQIRRSNLYLSLTFFVSAGLNFVLAEMILIGDPGSVKFNESLGRMTFLSFPVITIPMVIMVMFIILYLTKSIKTHTGLQLEDVIKNQ